jgi:hypothetical protein
MKDFFISYNKADKTWAEWIAWKLEQAGYTVIIQAWDFRPGGNFVLEMQNALKTTNKMVMVLSDDYLKSSFTAAEWSAVFATDPEEKKRKLVPVRVHECKPEGLLAPLIYVDIVGLSESDAEAALLGAFADRGKPQQAPKFPGEKSGDRKDQPLPAAFPGKTEGPGRIETVSVQAVTEAVPAGLPVSVREKIQLNSDLNAMAPGQFNMIIFALSPPPGLIPPMPAAQADRTSALLGWAESPTGCGLRMILEVLKQVTNPR